MATISTPLIAYQSTILTSTGTNQSSSTTITVNVVGWEIQIPIRVQQSNVSADQTINVYASMDGGATYDTTPYKSFSIARVASSPRIGQTSIRLTAGQYAIQLISSGPQSQTFQVNTQAVITAIQNA